MSFDKNTLFTAIGGDSMTAALIANHVANNGKSFTGAAVEQAQMQTVGVAQDRGVSGPVV